MSSSQEATKTPQPHFGGAWFLTLFAVEEIPAAMVTYVALLMLLQLGLAPAEATFCSALLFVPWVLKSFLRSWVSRVGHFRLVLYLIETLLFFGLLALAFAFRHGPVTVFFALMLVSLLCAWHELAARMYYERMLRPVFQRLLIVPKLVCSQVAVIFTYGALIFLVGTLEVYFRQIRYSWSAGCYVTAGILLLFGFLHLKTLSNSSSKGAGQFKILRKVQVQVEQNSKLKNAVHPEETFASWNSVQWLTILFFLLLPQALMFHARVLYLYDTRVHGGLQCTIQEIGFAQGTVGVIAFSLGIALGRLFIIKSEKLNDSSFSWPMALSLVLSPFVYLGMTFWPPQSLLALCSCTMLAQFLFGLGLSVCRLPLSAISGTLYHNTVNMLQIPFVSAAMLVPMAISGWMVEQLGYETYFFVNALSAPVCLLAVYLIFKTANRRTIKEKSE